MTTPSEGPREPVRRLHPLTPFFGVIAFFRQAALPITVGVFAGGDRAQLLLALPLLAATGYGALKYLRFTYRIDAGAIVVDEGLLTRKQRVVPLDRIQQVDVVAKLLHRLLGVATVKLDTASGGQSADIELAVVSRDEAERLRTVLGARRADQVRATVGADDGEGTGITAFAPVPAADIVRLGPGELALAGITGGRLLLLLTVLGPFTELFDDVPESLLRALGSAAAERSGAVVAAVFALVVLVVWFGAAALGSVLTYGGYTLTRRGGELHLACGALDRREATIPIERVQALRVHENIVRRAIGRVSARIQSGAVTGTRTQMTVPLLRRTEVDAVAAAVLPGAAGSLPPLVAAPPAARRRAIVRRVVPLAAVAGPAIALRPSAPTVATVVAVTALAAAAGELHYRGLGLGSTPALVVGRAGGLARTTVVVPAAKAQAVTVRSTPFQRRAGLATLVVAVAGGGQTPVVRDQPVARLEAVARQILAAAPADERRERERVRSLAAGAAATGAEAAAG